MTAIDHRVEVTRTVTGFRQAGDVMTRFNPLPIQELVAAGPDPDEVLRTLTATRRWLESNRETVTDALYELASAVSGEDRNRHVLPLRRDVHNRRPPRVDRVRLAALGAPPAVFEWLDREAVLSASERHLQELYQEKLAVESDALRRLCAEDDFAASVAMSSADLVADLVRFRDTPETAISAGLRKSEPAILRYAQRAMLRTSPFSRYTVISPAAWTGDAPADRAEVEIAIRTRCEINHVLVRRLLSDVVEDPASRPWLRYRFCDDWRIEDGLLVFRYQVDERSARPRVFKSTDRTASVRANRVLLRWMEWSDRNRRPATLLAELASQLAGAVPGLTAEGAQSFVGELVDAGLLQPSVPVPEQSADILGDARAFLRQIPTPAAAQAATALGEVAALVPAVGTADAEHRPQVLSRLASGLDAAFAATGRSRPKTTLVYEDAVNDSPVRLPQAGWERPLRDLGSLLAVLEASDPTHVLRVLVSRGFVSRFGRGGSCDDLKELRPVLDAALVNWGRAIAKPGESERLDPDLRALASLRDGFLSLCLRDPVEGEVRLDHADLARLAAKVPARVAHTWASYTVFVQPGVRPDGEPEFVLNHIYQGLGTFTSKFLHALPESQRQLARQRIASFFPSDRMLLEYRPVFGFNANLHPPLCDLEVGHDGDGSVPLGSFSARHDEASDQVLLIHRPSGRLAHFLYLGLLIPYLLPRRHTGMLALEGTSPIEVAAQLQQGYAKLEKLPVAEFPRVRLGSIVLARRAWQVSPEALPLPGRDEPEARFWSRFDAWRISLGMPRRLFYRLEEAATGTADGPAFEDMKARYFNRRPKLTYLDPHSALDIKQLRRTLLRSGPAGAHFVECLPTPDSAWLHSSKGRHVSELMIEFDRPSCGWTS